jgi:hypothetical protein
VNQKNYDDSCTLTLLQVRALFLICLPQSVKFVMFTSKVIYSSTRLTGCCCCCCCCCCRRRRRRRQCSWFGNPVIGMYAVCVCIVCAMQDRLLFLLGSMVAVTIALVKHFLVHCFCNTMFCSWRIWGHSVCRFA